MPTVFPQTVLAKDDGTTYDLSSLAGLSTGVAAATYADASISSATGASQSVAAAAAARKFLMIANPAATSWWINPAGGTAAASTQGSFELLPGAVWSPSPPPANAVTGIGTAASMLTVISA